MPAGTSEVMAKPCTTSRPGPCQPGLTADGETTSTKSRLRTIFLSSGGAFSEKRQVAKFDLLEKSFLTVISCYRIGASLVSQD